MAIHKRMLSRRGNLRRMLRVKAVPFIKYLKSNIKLCHQAARKNNNMNVVDLVPFSPDYSPRDVAQLGLAIRKCHNDWWKSSSRVSLVAATLAVGHTFIEAGVAVVGWPSFPWTDAYEARLRSRIYRSVDSETQIFSYRFTSISCQSFLSLNLFDLHPAVSAFIDVVKDCVRVAATAVSNAKIRAGDESGTHADDFYSDIQHKGMPVRGYSMHLSQCIWSYGGLAKGVFESDDGIFPPDTQTSVFHSNQSGTCQGLTSSATEQQTTCR
jgi:hypothetical protein